MTAENGRCDGGVGVGVDVGLGVGKARASRKASSFELKSNPASLPCLFTRSLLWSEPLTWYCTAS